MAQLPAKHMNMGVSFTPLPDAASVSVPPPVYEGARAYGKVNHGSAYSEEYAMTERKTQAGRTASASASPDVSTPGRSDNVAATATTTPITSMARTTETAPEELSKYQRFIMKWNVVSWGIDYDMTKFELFMIFFIASGILGALTGIAAMCIGYDILKRAQIPGYDFTFGNTPFKIGQGGFVGYWILYLAFLYLGRPLLHRHHIVLPTWRHLTLICLFVLGGVLGGLTRGWMDTDADTWVEMAVLYNLDYEEVIEPGRMGVVRLAVPAGAVGGAVLGGGIVLGPVLVVWVFGAFCAPFVWWEHKREEEESRRL